MEYNRKKPSGLLIFFGILAAVAVGMCLTERLYNTPARMYEEMWHIGLSPNIKEEYNVESDHGFQGDGLWYTVFRTDGSDALFLKGASGSKNGKMEEKIVLSLKSLRAEKEWYPDFTHPYLWKEISKDNDFKRLYLLYDPKNSFAYFLQDII